jgi:hypothetical protein
VRTVIDNTNQNATAANLIALGKSAGAHLFEVFDRYFTAGKWDISLMISVFDGWCKIEVLSAEDRLLAAGATADEISIWREACVLIGGA